MRFNYIKYKNYRCFRDVKIKFDTTDKRNIALIVAPNGGGKTEMLFSFWWVLYDFEFKSLKAKGYTPYALNSSLYQAMERSKSGKTEKCSVEVGFEDDYFEYVVKRTEVFTKRTNITSQQNLEFTKINKSNGTKGLPITDKSMVERQISMVLPQNILGGILFDGERMKQLSNIDDDAKKAVEGVIKQITNEELFSRCRLELEEILKDTNKRVRQISSGMGADSIKEVTNKIDLYKKSLEKLGIKVDAHKNAIANADSKIEAIHLELAQLEESKQLEEKRQALEKQLNDRRKELSDRIEDFHKDLYDGSILAASQLFADVRDSLENYDIPAGLTTEAVKSVLKRDRCICGHKMDDEMKDYLTQLLATLPPDNINSTISEMARYTEMHGNDKRSIMKRTYDEIKKMEKAISEIKDELASISKLITKGASEKAKELEKQRTECIRNRTKAEENLRVATEKIEDDTEQLNALIKERDNLSKSDSVLTRLNAKVQILEGFIDAFKEIHEENKSESLQNINERLNDAYEQLSEDRGRKLYIVQYDEKRRYRLLTYLESKFQQEYTNAVRSGRFMDFKRQDFTEEQIKESIILHIAENSSTGQSKINSLSFAKAILDYSNAKRGSDTTEISKSFPFLIDSPFTELSNENLSQSAMHIHEFADQVILMISEESLSGVEHFITPYVGARTELSKNETDSYSSVK